MASVIPREVKWEIVTGWAAEPWKVLLLKNTFLGVFTHGVHRYYGDIVAYELPNGLGYATGGATVTQNITAYDGSNNICIDALDVQWIGATFSGVNAVRYLVVYETTGGHIRAIYELTADYSVTSGTFTIQWNPTGLIKVSA